MARIKYTALVESIRGSIQGTTFQRNAYGHTIKSKPNMVKPIKSKQLIRQRDTTRSAQQWAAISAANRTAWNSYAENFPIAARLNPDSNLNGYNYFVKYHNFLHLDDPLGLLADPGATSYSFNFDPGVLELGTMPNSLTFVCELSDSSFDWLGLLFCTAPLKASQEFIQLTPRYMVSDETDQGATFEFYDEFVSAFGKAPQVGDEIGLKLVVLAADLGQMNFVSTFKKVITAA